MDLLSAIEKPTLPFKIDSNIGASCVWDEQLNAFKIEIPNGTLLYSQSYFPVSVSDRALRYLHKNAQFDQHWDDWSSLSSDQLSRVKFSNINWKQDHISLYGKQSPLPRLTAWYGDPGKLYKYSGIGAELNPWSQGLLYIKKKIEKMASTNFNSVLLNWYRTGEDHLSWHADDEKELGDNPTIGSVNFGETRDFILRRNDDTSQKIKIPLEHGSVLVMSGDIQRFWQHSVPKRKRITRSRINLTFREVL